MNENYKNVGSLISTFLGLQNSEMTTRNYTSWVEDFFSYAFNDKYSFVTVEQFESITPQMVENYRLYLKQIKNNSANTINSKVSALNKLFEYMYKSGFNIDPKRLEPFNTLKQVDNRYEAFTYEEALRMISKAKEYKNGKQKSFLIELAIMTGIRKNALLNITRENFKLSKKGWIIEVVDKGEKKSVVPITYDFYNNKVKPYIEEYEENQKIFKISERSVDYLIQNLKTDLRIKGNKVFHSLKKVHVNRIGDLSNGDLTLLQLAGKHSDISTTIKYYYEDVKLEDKYRATLELFGGIDIALLDSLPKETLLQVIKNCNVNVHIEMITKYNELANKQEEQNKDENPENKKGEIINGELQGSKGLWSDNRGH